MQPRGGTGTRVSAAAGAVSPMVKNHESLPTSPASYLAADSGEKESWEKTAAAVDGIREAKALILSLMKVHVPLFQRTMCLLTSRARE